MAWLYNMISMTTQTDRRKGRQRTGKESRKSDQYIALTLILPEWLVTEGFGDHGRTLTGIV